MAYLKYLKLLSLIAFMVLFSTNCQAFSNIEFNNTYLIATAAADEGELYLVPYPNKTKESEKRSVTRKRSAIETFKEDLVTKQAAKKSASLTELKTLQDATNNEPVLDSAHETAINSGNKVKQTYTDLKQVSDSAFNHNVEDSSSTNVRAAKTDSKNNKLYIDLSKSPRTQESLNSEVSVNSDLESKYKRFRLKAPRSFTKTTLKDKAALKEQANFKPAQKISKVNVLERNLKSTFQKLTDLDNEHEDLLMVPQIFQEQKDITQGKGIWVNLWNYPQDLDKFFTRLQDHHIETVYLQVNRSTTPVFKHPTSEIDEILKAAHQYHIKIIGWTYAYLNNVEADAKKFIEPAFYVSPEGYMFDAMAADVEENISATAIKKYTEMIKARMPKDYPMLIIVFSPKIKDNYPWQYLADNWDVFMPMVYWHGMRSRNLNKVAKFVSESIQGLRARTNKPDLKIHLITDGERTTPAEVALSIDIAKKLGVKSGISIYPEHLVPNSSLEMLKHAVVD
jgi:hypothetical protein